IQGGQTYEQSAQLFWNTGMSQPLFEPALPAQVGDDLFKPMVGRGCAYLDFDNGRDLDLIVVAHGGPARPPRNDTQPGHHAARPLLEGDGKKSNRSAIGAEVTIEAGGRVIRRQVAGARGYLSQSELPVTVGVGPTTKVDKITVRWPGKDAGPPQSW